MNDPSRQETQDDGLGGLVRRVLSPGPTPEERLEELLAERRRELDETAARFDATIADLERREELLRDSRTSVERMLRLGRTDLEARETELTDFLRGLTERETRMAESEAELARRRQELGAVELKRASVERRERDLEAREAELVEREAGSTEEAIGSDGAPEPVGSAEIAFVPGVEYRLLEVAVPSSGKGAVVEVDGDEFVVARIGPSPLPGDDRRCAYLVRGTTPPASHAAR